MKTEYYKFKKQWQDPSHYLPASGQYGDWLGFDLMHINVSSSLSSALNYIVSEQNIR